MDLKDWNNQQIVLWKQLVEEKLVKRNDTETFIKFSRYFAECLATYKKAPEINEIKSFLGLK